MISSVPDVAARGRAARLGLFLAVSCTGHAALIASVWLAPASGYARGAAPALESPAVTINAEIAIAAPAAGLRATAAAPSAPLPATVKNEAGGTGGTKVAQRAEARDRGAVEAPASVKWYRAEELDVRAEPLQLREFEYPASLRGSRLRGKVRLRLFIDERGVVRKIEIAGSEPAGVFDDAARQAWSQVRFSPAQKHGAAVKSQKLIELAYAPE